MLVVNAICNVGAECIARALEMNTTITRINLRGWRVARCLLLLLLLSHSHTQLEGMRGGNKIREPGKDALVRAMARNTTLTALKYR